MIFSSTEKKFGHCGIFDEDFSLDPSLGTYCAQVREQWENHRASGFWLRKSEKMSWGTPGAVSVLFLCILSNS
jgi:hypothetical protein